MYSIRKKHTLKGENPHTTRSLANDGFSARFRFPLMRKHTRATYIVRGIVHDPPSPEGEIGKATISDYVVRRVIIYSWGGFKL